MLPFSKLVLTKDRYSDRLFLLSDMKWRVLFVKPKSVTLHGHYLRFLNGGLPVNLS